MKRETSLGGGLYLDNRSNSYLWRGRVNGKPATKRIKHVRTGVVGTSGNMTRTEARAIAKQIAAEAARGGAGTYFPIKVAGLTVDEAWKLYWKRDAQNLRSASEKQRAWDRYLSLWANRQLSSITKRDCAAMIERCRNEIGGAGYAANQLHKNARRFFGWCADEGYGATGLEVSPMVGMAKKPVNTGRTARPPRALEERELIWLFSSLEELGGREAQAVEFLLRSLCRRDENFAAKWSWLRGDENLLIPATKAVGRNAVSYPLLLPLTSSMRKLIGDRPKGSAPDAPLWGVTSSWLAHWFLKVRRTMTGLARKEGVNADFINEFIGEARNEHYFSFHDFRDTGKLNLRKITRLDDGLPKFAAEIREAVLNHRDTGIAKVYGADVSDADYLYEPRRLAGIAWNDILDELKERSSRRN